MTTTTEIDSLQRRAKEGLDRETKEREALTESYVTEV